MYWTFKRFPKRVVFSLQETFKERRVMTRTLFLIAINTLFAFSVLVAGDDYLKEKPSFLKPCRIHRTDKDNEHCFATAFENLFTNWKDGVPGLKGLSPIDPFHVKKLRLSQSTPNLADIQVELRNLVATGMSKTKVLDSSVSEKDYTFHFHLKLPHLKVESDYKLKGRLLFLNLDGHGKAQSKISDLDYTVFAKTTLKRVGDESFFDVLSISSKINSIGNFNMDFSNLFNGNAGLEDSARQLFRENWREIFDIMRPAILQTLDSVVLNRYKRIFSYIPARFFIEDLP